MTKIEFSLVCRLCVQKLEKEKISPLFNNKMYKNTISLPEIIKLCSSVEVVEGDGLPPQICTTCLVKLDQSFTFRNQCVLADKTLKHFKNLNFVNETPELLKVDYSKQILKLENDGSKITKNSNVDCEDKSENIFSFNDVCDSKTEISNEDNCVIQEKCIQKITSQHAENDLNFVSFCNLPEKSQNIGCNNFLTLFKREKEKSKKQGFKENHIEGKKQIKKKRPRILKRNKKNDISISDKSFVDKKDFLENPELHTCKSEVHSFSKKNENLALIDTVKQSAAKDFKSNTRNVKKGKARKVAANVKEKPTSYTCHYCQKVYPSEGGWRYHIHTMHNENYQPFICDLCGQAFKVKKNLEGHKNSIHFHLKHHLCDLCGRGFASKYALKVHKIWHSDEKNYTCDICGTKFRTRGKMNTHRSIHGGPKKFMCHICSRDFRWKKDFEIHMRTHTGEKPFKCSYCGKAFASLTNMKKHEKNHVEKFRCSKNSESLEISNTAVDERLYRSEFLNFSYDETGEVRN